MFSRASMEPITDECRSAIAIGTASHQPSIILPLYDRVSPKTRYEFGEIRSRT
jgi:hypothetical protein